jgi:hypothetical protein
MEMNGRESRMARIILGIITLMLAGDPCVAAEKTNQLPTATEVFNLRSRCAALGEKLLEGNIIGTGLSQYQISHYNARTNRCYVELSIQTAETAFDYVNRVLYDGQTNEVLASAWQKKGKLSGMVFDKEHKITTLENSGFDDANSYIDDMMADDRK